MSILRPANQIPWHAIPPSAWTHADGHTPVCHYNGMRAMVRIDRWYTEGDDMNPAPWTRVETEYHQGVIQQNGDIALYDPPTPGPFAIITLNAVPKVIPEFDESGDIEDEEPRNIPWSANGEVWEYVSDTHNDRVKSNTGIAHQCYWVLLDTPRTPRL